MACLWHPVSLAQKSGGMQTQEGPGSTSPRGMAGGSPRPQGCWLWVEAKETLHVTLALVTALLHTLCYEARGRNCLGAACRAALAWGLK